MYNLKRFRMTNNFKVFQNLHKLCFIKLFCVTCCSNIRQLDKLKYIFFSLKKLFKSIMRGRRLIQDQISNLSIMNFGKLFNWNYSNWIKLSRGKNYEFQNDFQDWHPKSIPHQSFHKPLTEQWIIRNPFKRNIEKAKLNIFQFSV